MKLSGSGWSEERKKLAAVAGFVVVAGVVAYFELRGTSVPVAPASVSAVSVVASPAGSGAGVGAAAAGPGAKLVGTSSAALDPTLRMEAMLVSEAVEYLGSGRNIFSAASAPPPVAIPKPVAPARVVAAVAAPVVAMPAGPPPPPPIDLKLFGVMETTANGTRQVFLLHGDDVFLASAGDVVMRRYRVVSIAARSAEVEDLQYNDKQVLVLQPN